MGGGYFAQENVIPNSGNVGIGTLNPTTKLDVHGRVNIDSSLVVKDSVTIQKNLRVLNGVDAYGLTNLNGQLKLSALSTLTNLSNSYFLLSNNGGIVKRYGSEELIEELRNSIYKDPIKQPNFCDLPQGNSNPTWSNGLNKIYSTCPDVKVGIGTDSPTHGLHVTTNAKINNTLYTGQSIGIGVEADNFARLTISNTNHAASIFVKQLNPNPYSKLIYMEFSEPTTEILKVTNTSNGHTPYLFEASGRFTIHNGTKKTLQLDADGLLHARKIRVDTDSWADFVFNKEYNLLPLYEVEKFIKENSHLPNIPSENEIIENGIDVAEMNVLLIQKIEELTLYIIEQQKQLDEIKKEMINKN